MLLDVKTESRRASAGIKTEEGPRVVKSGTVLEMIMQAYSHAERSQDQSFSSDEAIWLHHKMEVPRCPRSDQHGSRRCHAAAKLIGAGHRASKSSARSDSDPRQESIKFKSARTSRSA